MYNLSSHLGGNTRATSIGNKKSIICIELTPYLKTINVMYGASCMVHTIVVT